MLTLVYGRHGDFLSSIEIFVADQLDVLNMQNWSHLQVKSTYSTLLKQSHISLIARPFLPQPLTKRVSRFRFLSHQALVLGWLVRVSITSWASAIGTVTSFSASRLRQSILLSSYETPETRSLFNKELKNVAGRIRTEALWSPVEVPEGIQQVCNQFRVTMRYAQRPLLELYEIRVRQCKR
jgi:U3 small nucleolar RNA-associated protein 25